MNSEEALMDCYRKAINGLERENQELKDALALMRQDGCRPSSVWALQVEIAELKEALTHYKNFPPPHPLCAPGTVHIGDPNTGEGLGAS